MFSCSIVVKWDRGVQTYLMLSVLDVWFVLSQLSFVIPSLRMGGTSSFKIIGDLHARASSSIKSKILMEGTMNFEVRQARQWSRWWNQLTSYFGQLKVFHFVFFRVKEKMFDYWLIPEFRGATTDEPVRQWIQHVKMICNLYKRTDVELILLLHRWGGALAIYQQLNKDEKVGLQHKTATHSCLHSWFVQCIQSICSSLTLSGGDGKQISSRFVVKICLSEIGRWSAHSFWDYHNT